MFSIAAFYNFFRLDQHELHRERLLALMERHEVNGTILLAAEGFNGTIAGPAEGVEVVLDALRALPDCPTFDVKFSEAPEQPFLRRKVRLKKEIVTMGVEGIDPNLKVGRYVRPEAWNAVLADPDTVVIDTRNDYEVGIGTFQGAINPKTDSFREFPAWFDQFRADNPDKKIAMFCTGGIRCEKATSYVLSQGVDDVVHLHGGILKYLEEVAEEDSRWDGECFVFDGRVSVRHGLEPGTYDQCFACRRPIDDEMKADRTYQPGVSCPQCTDEYSDEERKRFAERSRQIALAASRGEKHLGR